MDATVEDSDSRTAVIGQKRARNEEIQSQLASSKRQRRGTEDDAISIGGSSDHEEDVVSEMQQSARNGESVNLETRANDAPPRYDHDDNYISISSNDEQKPKNNSGDSQEKQRVKQTRRERRAAKILRRQEEEKGLERRGIGFLKHRIELPKAGSRVLVLWIDLASMREQLPNKPQPTVEQIYKSMIEYCAIHFRNVLAGVNDLHVGNLKKGQDKKCALYLQFCVEGGLAVAAETVGWVKCSLVQKNANETASFQLNACPYMDLLDDDLKLPVRPLPKKRNRWFAKAVNRALSAEEQAYISATKGTSHAKGLAQGLSAGALGSPSSVDEESESSESEEMKDSAEASAYNPPEPVNVLSPSPSVSDDDVIEHKHPTSAAPTYELSSASEGEILSDTLTPSNPIRAAQLPPTGSVRLQDLSESERYHQALYWNITTPSALVRCPTCSHPGHTTATCPSRRCPHCTLIDAHFPSACPTILPCSKCRTPGHTPTTCPAKLTRSAADGFTCTICAGAHPGEDCSWIWRTFNPLLLPTVSKLQTLPVVSCYLCGAAGHWGDDCPAPELRRNVPPGSVCNTFSAAYANLFTVEQAGPPARARAAPGGQGFSIKGRGGRRAPEDGEEEDGEIEDDDSAFYNKRRQHQPAAGGSRRGAIQVNVGRQAAHEPYANTAQRSGRGGGGGGQGYRSVPPPQSFGNGNGDGRGNNNGGNNNGGNNGGGSGSYRGGRFAQERRDLPPRPIDQARSRYAGDAPSLGPGSSRRGRGGGGRGGFGGRGR